MSGGAVKWDDLRVFLEVARQGTVHAAAKKLKLDHSTVCRRIGKLEDLLAIKLLDRSQRGIVVRGGVQQLLDHIESMETHAISIEDALTGSLTTATQTVRVATMEGIASQYLARRIGLLDGFAPNVKVELVSMPQPADLSRKEADIFLSFFNPRLPGLSSRKVADVALFLYCSESYVRVHGLPRSLDDLKDHVFIAYIDDLLAIDAVRWLDDLIKSPKVSFYSNSILAQCNAAIAGVGIAMLPTFVAAGVPGLMRVIPEKAVVRRDIWISVRKEQGALTRIRSVMKFLTHIFEADRLFLLGETEGGRRDVAKKLG
jgi:DNA-binding transcriptional LysR family regulator